MLTIHPLLFLYQLLWPHCHVPVPTALMSRPPSLQGPGSPPPTPDAQDDILVAILPPPRPRLGFEPVLLTLKPLEDRQGISVKVVTMSLQFLPTVGRARAPGIHTEVTATSREAEGAGRDTGDPGTVPRPAVCLQVAVSRVRTLPSPGPGTPALSFLKILSGRHDSRALDRCSWAVAGPQLSPHRGGAHSHQL